MFKDLRRICEHPDEEDKKWFPEIADSDWLTTLDFAMRNFKDESFINQFLSPRLIRELRLFSVLDDDNEDELEISAIHDEHGYRHIRNRLAKQYDLSMREPNIQVYNVDLRGDRSLTLRHIQQARRPLNKDTNEVIRHLARLWGFHVRIETVNEDKPVNAS
jgi:spore cortex formation protein SpoVR/YcgB (stage V sporulation)